MSRVFAARFGGRCAADCGERIHEGDDVCFVDDELVHERCVEALNDENDHRRPEQPACSSCWTVHVGECM